MTRLTLTLLASAAVARATIISVPVNITTGTGSSASQSTTHPAGPANNGIDGNPGNFTHTNPPEAGLAPGWWEVNLGTDRTFTNMRILNRGDGCCQYRLQDINVEVRDASNTVLFSQTGLNPGNALGGPSFLDLSTGLLNTARFVKITRIPIPGQEATHDGATLSIGELIVANQSDILLPAGSNLTHSNIHALAVSQTSTLGGQYAAGSAINGTSGDFTHTVSTDTNPSWTVDFGEVMNLESFSIDNRSSCCGNRLRDITVTVKDSFGTPLYSTPLLNPENALGSPLTLSGSFPVGTTGRYVTISRTPDPDWSGQGGSGSADDTTVLSMAEVNIFGSSVPEPTTLMLLPLAAAALLRRRR